MRTLYVLLTFVFSSVLFAQNKTKEPGTDTMEVKTTVIEKKPVYPGCEHLETEEERNDCFANKIMQHIAQNFSYPEDARQEEKQGRVVVNFVVEKDGSVSDVKVVRSVYPSIDEEAVRVIRMLPVMQPAVQRGRPVRMSFNIPINAKVDNKRNKRRKK
jgi:periplasmic protein TonB